MKKAALVSGIVAGIVLGLLILVIVAGQARAAWTDGGQAQPPTWLMSVQAPVKQSPVAAGEIHWTVSTKGECMDIDCTVDCRVLISTSGAPVTCTSTTCQPLPAKTILTRCAQSSQDYVSIYMTAAGDGEYALHNIAK